MERTAFTASQRRHVVRAERDYLAFVPPSLPPSLPLTPELVRSLSAADRAVGRLAGLSFGLPNPLLMSHTLVRREAVLSSRIEGTHATFSDLALFEVDQSGVAADDVQEVFNYVAAAEHVLSPGRRLPLSLPLLCEAHHILLTGVRGGYATPGEFRRSQNWIGSPGATLNTATYVPPPPERLWDCLDAFEKYLHAPRELPTLIDVACIHYQFEAIHPFIDGNGRLGRLLVTLLLAEWGLLPAALLDLSAFLEPRRNEYYAKLLAVTQQGDWLGWVLFFLEAVATQAADATERAQRLMKMREAYREQIAAMRSASALVRLVDALFVTPALTIQRAADTAGISRRAATLNIDKLIEAGILDEAPSAGRTRLFLARRIIATINGDT